MNWKQISKDFDGISEIPGSKKTGLANSFGSSKINDTMNNSVDITLKDDANRKSVLT